MAKDLSSPDPKGLSSTDLFISPCPPHKAQTANDRNMHRADALDGTASQYNVNLFYKHFDNDIVCRLLLEKRRRNNK